MVVCIEFRCLVYDLLNEKILMIFKVFILKDFNCIMMYVYVFYMYLVIFVLFDKIDCFKCLIM